MKTEADFSASLNLLDPLKRWTIEEMEYQIWYPIVEIAFLSLQLAFHLSYQI